MMYGVIFIVFGVATALYMHSIAGIYWLGYWISCSFILAGLAYLSSSPRILGKKQDGAIHPLHILMLMPFFVITWLIWHIQIRLTQEDRFDEIMPGYFLGRRPLAGELPAGIGLVVDLTAEFSEPSKIVSSGQYLSYPMLDGIGSEPESFSKLIEKIESSEEKKYIHCAQGHGRSAAVMAGILIKKGLVVSVDEAEEYIKNSRPGIRINGSQKRLLAEYQQYLQIR